ncbi:MAG: hypothetical protein ACXWJW_10935 [Xanthobacteraceae bacterium]
MRRLWFVAALTALTVATSAHAQFKGGGGDPRAPKTGRTEEGLKVDAEIDKEYRAKAGQRTPDVKADPWGDVRALPTQTNSKPPKVESKATKKP